MTTGYRRLPGRQRGIFYGSSVWFGGDHLLLARTIGFREEYKRFHLGDIQAIAVARAPRFHISWRAVVIGVVWLLAFWFTTLMRPIGSFSLTPYFWIAAALLVVAWAIFSGAFSCRCRIYTAVSADELPSVYRTWTARRFLAAVEPKIAQVQGVIEGQWAEAAEERNIGPPAAGQPIGSGAPDVRPLSRARSHTLISDLLIAVLFAAGLLDFMALNAAGFSLRPLTLSFMAAKIGLAVAIFVQHYRGTLQSGMQRIAMATLLVMGGTYYIQQLAVGFSAGAAAANKQAKAPLVPEIGPPSRVVAQLEGGAQILLGCAGLGIILFSKETAAS